MPLIFYSLDFFFILIAFGYVFFHEIAVRSKESGGTVSPFLLAIFTLFLLSSFLFLLWIWLISFRLYKLGKKGREGKYIQNYSNDFRASQMQFKIESRNIQRSMIALPTPNQSRLQGNSQLNFQDENANGDGDKTPDDSIHLSRVDFGRSSARRM